MAMNFDKEELEQLYRKKYGGLLKFTETDELALLALETKKFSKYSQHPISTLETPLRDRPLVDFASFSALTDSSSCSSNSNSSSISKSSSGLAKVLSENKAFKIKFSETRIADVETEIFAMHQEFSSAADYHAPFLLYMKSN